MEKTYTLKLTEFELASLSCALDLAPEKQVDKINNPKTLKGEKGFYELWKTHTLQTMGKVNKALGKGG